MNILSVKDQLDREVKLTEYPRSIISLVPSFTGLLIKLGLKDEIVGITDYCPALSNASRIGGTKNFSRDKIKLLNPDLIIACKEENTKEGIEELSCLYPVWIGDIYNLDTALLAILAIGTLTGKTNEASIICNTISRSFHKLSDERKRLGAVYLIWRKPFMTVGGDTFISNMLYMAGFNNLYQHHLRYPEITLEELSLLQPEFIFLSSEPFPFAQKHIEEFQSHCPESKIVLVKGEYFSWYGSKLLESPSYFEKLRKDLVI